MTVHARARGFCVGAEKMASCNRHTIPVLEAPWLTEQGLELSRFPIDSILRQALSQNEEEFRSGCTLLSSMSHGGRVEAGVFLLGLLRQYPEDYGRLTLIAEALGSFPTAATVDAFASELRRVKGSSATRGYLRSIISALERFPAQLADEKILELSTDQQVGARFRHHLRSIALRYLDD
ncbi:MAG: hypothetical protein HY017_17600 [Betaproteobacteria bacterium]|nr:hypothetical protein [Betaproteobacteria bacterium]